MSKRSKRSVPGTPAPSKPALQPLKAVALAHAQARWQQGDWAALMQIELAQLAAQPAHPDRAQLCALVASAWAQAGDQATAQHFLRQALDWGCDKRLVTQLLVAGMHNTLGRAAAIAGDQVRMEQHFRLAVAGSGNQIERASLGRRHVELQRLGLEQTGCGIPPAIPHALNDQETAITYPPHGITSYAQNFEDVMLWRALWDVEDGFYIDVGAFDPVIDSVSKAFYEKGWRGVHVEPLLEYAEKIRLDRPDEKVYQCLIASKTGALDFYELYGISTGIEDIAISNAKSLNQRYKLTQCSAMSLSDIFDDVGKREIHWMKIDVEGMETDVLLSWGNHHARPWIVVVEATIPLTAIQNWDKWDPHMRSREYLFAYFDGLNRYYVHQKHKDLIKQLSIQPNVFDNYTIHVKT